MFFDERMRRMKKTLLLLAICSFLVYSPTPAHALFGGGISGPLPVYNIDKTVDVATITTQVNTYEQLQAMLKNLASMDASTAAGNMTNIQAQLTDLITLQQQTQGMLVDYQNFQEQWNETYKDYSDANGMTALDYANQVEALRQFTEQNMYDTMRSQGLISGMETDANYLNRLLASSQSAEGTRAALQAANQIAGLQIQQLMRFQQMLSDQNRAQTTYYMEQKKRQELGGKLLEQGLQSSSEDTNEPLKAGNGSGFHF